NIVSDNQVVAARTTDASGFWQVKGLSAGTGEADVLTAGRAPTNPADGKYTGSMSSGQQNANLNFGLNGAGPAPAIDTRASILVVDAISIDLFTTDAE